MTEPTQAPKSLIWPFLQWLVTGETLLFAIAVPVSLSVSGARFPHEQMPGYAWVISAALAFGVVMTLVTHAFGMHALRARSSAKHQIFKYIGIGILASGLLWAIMNASPQVTVTLTDVVAAVTFSLVCLMIWRQLVMGVVDSSKNRTRILVLGTGVAAATLRETLRRRADRRGLEIVGYCPCGTNGECSIPEAEILHTGDDLKAFCNRHRIDAIVIDDKLRDDEIPHDELLECRFHGVVVRKVTSFIEQECGKIPVELAQPTWWLFGDGFSQGRLYGAYKRLFDLIVSVVLLVITAPLSLACALAIIMEDGRGATILFRQRRVGKDGTGFILLKFRSMSEDAEKDGVARWATKDDKRITSVGRVLRKYRLDELPQLINVLRGDMSLVGPRPERPEFVKELEEYLPYYDRRHYIRPGITGWAQLCYPYGASRRDALEKLKYDLYYIKNQTFAFDLAIFMRTVEVVIFGKGAR